MVLISLQISQYLHGVLAGDLALTLDIVCLILFKQELDSACETGNNLILFLLDFWPVDLDAGDLDTQSLKMFVGIFILVGDVQQCLGWDAPNIQAGSSESTSFLDADGLEAELGCLDSCYIA